MAYKKANPSSSGKASYSLAGSGVGMYAGMPAMPIPKSEKIRPKLWYLGPVTPHLLNNYESVVGHPEVQKEIDQSPPIVKQSAMNRRKVEWTRDVDVDHFLRGFEHWTDPSKNEKQKNQLQYVLYNEVQYGYQPSRTTKSKGVYADLGKLLTEDPTQKVAKDVEKLLSKYSLREMPQNDISDRVQTIYKTEKPISYLHPRLTTYNAPNLSRGERQAFGGLIFGYARDTYTMAIPPIIKRQATQRSTL